MHVNMVAIKTNSSRSHPPCGLLSAGASEQLFTYLVVAAWVGCLEAVLGVAVKVEGVEEREVRDWEVVEEVEGWVGMGWMGDQEGRGWERVAGGWEMGGWGWAGEQLAEGHVQALRLVLHADTRVYSI
jgi:hypothetical protein